MTRLLVIDIEAHKFTVYEGRRPLIYWDNEGPLPPLGDVDLEEMRLWRPEPTEAA